MSTLKAESEAALPPNYIYQFNLPWQTVSLNIIQPACWTVWRTVRKCSTF